MRGETLAQTVVSLAGAIRIYWTLAVMWGGSFKTIGDRSRLLAMQGEGETGEPGREAALGYALEACLERHPPRRRGPSTNLKESAPTETC